MNTEKLLLENWRVLPQVFHKIEPNCLMSLQVIAIALTSTVEPKLLKNPVLLNWGMIFRGRDVP